MEYVGHHQHDMKNPPILPPIATTFFNLPSLAIKWKILFCVAFCMFVLLYRRQTDHPNEFNTAWVDPYWSQVQTADRCASYGVRGYTATLKNIPYPTSYHWQRACQETSIIIQNTTMKPDRCEISVSITTFSQLNRTNDLNSVVRLVS
jgi:hypothetical protein